MSEAGAGSDVVSMKCRAEKRGQVHYYTNYNHIYSASITIKNDLNV